MEPNKGKILISAPNLDDIFSRSVVYLTEHDDKGTVGFILNKTTKVKISDAIDDFPEYNAKVFLGGPVQSELINFIHCAGEMIPDGYEIADGVFWGGNFEVLKQLTKSNLLDPKLIKFFIGYSGWSAGQLDDEMKRNSWYVSEINKNDIFSYEEDILWQRMLKNMGGIYKMISSFPKNPGLN